VVTESRFDAHELIDTFDLVIADDGEQVRVVDRTDPPSG
jgi:hypothetical protein